MIEDLQQSEAEMPQCPSYLPQKFWDEKRGQPRMEAMAHSYREMERKIGSGRYKRVPGHHSEYCVECKSELFSNDDAVNKRLHQAGFTNEQVQLVYDLAHEALEPLVAEIAADLYSHQQIDRLCNHFGGEERWMETARQLRSWGTQKFGPDALDAMCCSYDGVLSLYDMMTKGDEPDMGRFGERGTLDTDTDVRKLMRDPKYWRDQDPATVERVRAGFRRLYPG